MTARPGKTPALIAVPHGPFIGPSARSDGGLTARSLLSGLDSTAFALAVYASPSRSPGPTRDALLAVGQLYQVGLATHRVSTKGFRVTSLPPFPTYPDARTTQFSSRAGGENELPRKAVMPALPAATAWFGLVTHTHPAVANDNRAA
jgi:hypothetical protein